MALLPSKVTAWRMGACSLWSDTSGAAMVEYIVLLGVVSIAIAAAIAGLGPTLLASYERARGILIAPIP